MAKIRIIKIQCAVFYQIMSTTAAQSESHNSLRDYCDLVLLLMVEITATRNG